MSVPLRGAHQRSGHEIGLWCVRWSALEGTVPNLTKASVGGKDDDGGQRGLQRAVQVREALDIQHVHLHGREQSGKQESLVRRGRSE
jgi:hypothetical protein